MEKILFLVLLSLFLFLITSPSLAISFISGTTEEGLTWKL